MGMPIGDDVAAVVAGNSRASAMTSGADVLGLMLLGGSYSSSGSGTSHTYTSSATFAIELTQLSSLKDLELAVVDGAATGTGFDALRLEVIREGLAVVDHTFSDLATALANFQDKVFNFADIETGNHGQSA